MKKQTIALDIDDVLSRNVEHFVEWSNNKWGTALTVDDFDEDFEVLWKIDYEEAQKRFNQYLSDELVKDHTPIKESIPVIKRLQHKYDFVLVTSRRSLLAPATRKWIDRHFPDLFERIHHTGFFDTDGKIGHIKTKADICRELGADFLIDDQPKHCFAAAEAGLETVLFGDYIWNTQLKTLPPRVTWAKSWQEVEDYFDGRD